MSLRLALAARVGAHSRAAARRRWADVSLLAGWPLAVGLGMIGLGNLAVVVSHWADFHDPWRVLSVFVVSCVLVGALWWRGPSGIGPLASAVAAVCVWALLLVAWGELTSAGLSRSNWMSYWSAAVPGVLAFGRPLIEPVLIALGSTVLNAAMFARRAAEVAPGNWQDAVNITLGPLVFTVSAVAVFRTLRSSATATRRARERAESLTRRIRVADAVADARQSRFGHYEAAVVPLLERIAAEPALVHDPDTADACRRLAQDLRRQLSATDESVLDDLLAAEVALLDAHGGRLEVVDLDVAHRLSERERLLVVELVRQVCERSRLSAVTVTALPVAGTPRAWVAIEVEGAARPQTRTWTEALQRSGARRTERTATHWWWDCEFACAGSAG